jgi:type IV pilus assembly protein PilN
MIRINLLNVPKAKGRRATPAASVPGDGVSVSLKVLLVLVIAGALNAGYWVQLSREKTNIATQMQEAERKNQELAQVKAKYLERQAQMQAYKHRVDVIDQLRAGQFGPVNLLSTLGNTVNTTEAVWLDSVKDDGGDIDIHGMALSEDAVANLVNNLQKTGYFKSVEMRETYQEAAIKEMQAFTFTLTCAKQKS